MGSVTVARRLPFGWIAGSAPAIRPSWPGLASGTRTSLDLGPDHRASTVHFNESLLLTGDVGIRTGVSASLMGFALLFASSYFSVITPQGGSQNVIFVAAGYLSQGELYRLGALTTVFCVFVFLLVGTPWLRLVTR